MFWFCKPKPLDVYFYTTREEIFNHAKPQKAVNYIPEWVKNLPVLYTEPIKEQLIVSNTLKTCPGFVNLYRSGFMLTLWSDLNVEIGPEYYRYQFADRKSGITKHFDGQLKNSQISENYIPLKLECPWHMETKEKVNFLFSAPVWNNFGHGDIVVAPGAYAPNFGPFNANINLLFKRSQEITLYQLLFGQPLVHVLPLTERPIRLHYSLIDQKELDRLENKTPLLLMASNRYRRADKLCPHA